MSESAANLETSASETEEEEEDGVGGGVGGGDDDGLLLLLEKWRVGITCTKVIDGDDDDDDDNKILSHVGIKEVVPAYARAREAAEPRKQTSFCNIVGCPT